MTKRDSSFASSRFVVAAAALLLAACVSKVRLAPEDDGRTSEPGISTWTVEGGVAKWTVDEVDIVVPLDTEAGEFPARGVIVNRGSSPARVSFAPAAGDAQGCGRLGDAQLVPIDAGKEYELPSATFDGPGRLPFALRPDEPWPGLPENGASLTWTITVATPWGESRCPLRFHVAAGSHELSHTAKVVITVVVALVLVVLVVAALVLAAENAGRAFSLPAPTISAPPLKMP